MSLIQHNMLRYFFNVMENSQEKFIVDVLSIDNRLTTSFIDTVNRLNYKKTSDDTDIHPIIFSFLYNTGVFHRMIETKTLADAEQQVIYNNIYAKWDSLSKSIRQFYMDNMLVLKKIDDKWKIVKLEYYSMILPSSEFKLSIKKNADNEPLFACNLPLMSYASSKIFVNENISTNINNDILKYIYLNGYYENSLLCEFANEKSFQRSKILQVNNLIFFNIVLPVYFMFYVLFVFTGKINKV